MIQSHRSPRAASFPPLQTVTVVRRRRPLRLAPPVAAARPVVQIVDERSWVDDLRFFLAAYAAGMLFLLVMLS